MEHALSGTRRRLVIVLAAIGLAIAMAIAALGSAGALGAGGDLDLAGASWSKKAAYTTPIGGVDYFGASWS